MKRKKPYLLAGLVLLLFLLCTACGNTEGQIAPQDDPNEGLGGGLSEDTVNDFSGFEGIWLGEADNDYDSMEFDAEGNWTLYLSGMRTPAVSPRMTSPIPRRTRCPTGTAVWTETRTPIGAGIPTSASEMSRNSRAFGTMTAISRLRPISSSTVMETGAITSALPALSLRKWTAEFSPTPWMR